MSSHAFHRVSKPFSSLIKTVAVGLGAILIQDGLISRFCTSSNLRRPFLQTRTWACLLGKLFNPVQGHRWHSARHAEAGPSQRAASHAVSIHGVTGMRPPSLTPEGGDTGAAASGRWRRPPRRQPCAGWRPSPKARPLCNSFLCHELPARSKVTVTDNLSELQLPHLGKGDNQGSPRSRSEEVVLEGRRLELTCSSTRDRLLSGAGSQDHPPGLWVKAPCD